MPDEESQTSPSETPEASAGAAPEAAASAEAAGAAEANAASQASTEMTAGMDDAELDAIAARAAADVRAGNDPAPEAPAGAAPPAAAESAETAGDANLIDQGELDSLIQAMNSQTAAAPPPKKKPAPAPAAAPVMPAAAAPPSALPLEPAVRGARIKSLTADAAETVEVPDLEEPANNADTGELDLLNDVELDVKIELGRTMMYVEDILRLKTGSVVELDKLAGDPVDIFVNERLVARGEVLVLNDNFCVRVNDIISPTSEMEEVR